MLWANPELQLPFEENKKYNCQFEFQKYYEGLQNANVDGQPISSQMFYGTMSLNFDYTIFSGSWQNDRLTLIFILENLVSNFPKFFANDDYRIIRDTLTITINRKGEIIGGNPAIFKKQFLGFINKVNPHLAPYYQQINFNIFDYISGRFQSENVYRFNNRNYNLSYTDSSQIQLDQDNEESSIHYTIKTEKNREFSCTISNTYRETSTVSSNLNRPLIFNLSYFIKELPQGMVRVVSKGESLQEYQLYITPAQSSLDSSLYIRYKSLVNDRIRVNSSTPYNVWIFHEKTKTQQKHRIFLEPGSTLEVIYHGEGHFPVLYSHLDHENQVATEIFNRFRGNRIYDVFAYFNELMHGMDQFEYYEFLESNWSQEVEYLSSMKDKLNQEFYNYLYWDSYFLYAYQILKLYGIRNYRSPHDEFTGILKKRVDTIQIYNSKAEKSPAYHRFLIEKFEQYQRELSKLNGDSYWSYRNLQPTTSYYLAQDFYELYPRDYLMKEIVKEIIQDLNVDINTISHIIDDFNTQIKNEKLRNEIQYYFTQRSNLSVGSTLPKFVMYNESGEILHSKHLSRKHQLIIYDRNNALDLLDVQKFNEYTYANLFNMLVTDQNQKIPIIYIVNQISQTTSSKLNYLRDTLQLEIALYQLKEQEKNFNETFSVNFSKASNIFPLLISPQHEILYLGNQTRISLHNLMQTLSEDHAARKQKLIRWLLGGGFVLANLVLLFFLFHELKTRYIRKEAEKRYADVQLKLQALRGQLNPHFLFNCLSTIRGLIEDHKSSQAIGYLEEFSDFVRIVLLSNKHKLIPLVQELEFAKKYIYLEQMRFDFEVIFDIDTQLQLANVEVPPLILQPYIENAIKHGLSTLKNGILNIRVHQEAENVIIEITDNGCGLANSPFQGNGVGLKLNSDRLNLIFDERAAVKIESVSERNPLQNGTKVLINIPIE